MYKIFVITIMEGQLRTNVIDFDTEIRALKALHNLNDTPYIEAYPLF